MAAPDDFLYEYSVIRYVPRVDREEFINIGLLMLCKRRKWLMGRVKLDIDRITAFDPKVNIERLQSQSEIFTKKNIPSADIPEEEKYRWLSAVKSAVLQVSPSHPGIVLVDSALLDSKPVSILEKEFDRLFNDLVS